MHPSTCDDFNTASTFMLWPIVVGSFASSSSSPLSVSVSLFVLIFVLSSDSVMYFPHRSKCVCVACCMVPNVYLPLQVPGKAFATITTTKMSHEYGIQYE